MMIYFTGHEKESDLAEGIYTTEYRLYDTRVGRWLSVDPLFEKYVGMSPYNYCMLNPVMMVDPDGRETEYIEENLDEDDKKFPLTTGQMNLQNMMRVLIVIGLRGRLKKMTLLVLDMKNFVKNMDLILKEIEMIQVRVKK
jgi:RHS repeat-associated protein